MSGARIIMNPDSSPSIGRITRWRIRERIEERGGGRRGRRG
jgi:hypothetical protein